MHAPQHTPRPALRALIGEIVAAHPAGLTTDGVRAAVASRCGVGPWRVLCELGQLLVEGGLDECDGVWMPTASAARAPQTARRAA